MLYEVITGGNLAEVLEKQRSEDFVMAGQTNLMGFQELCDISYNFV